MKFKTTPILAVFMLSCLFISCEKAEQFIQKAVLNQIITNDRWLVENFSVSDTDVTSEYSQYEFEFNKVVVIRYYDINELHKKSYFLNDLNNFEKGIEIEHQTE